ncbi:unnamed protein product [Durusdinium trenchii]|uniref:Uncharacterized protein n=1 Tax=Durusdinium trenchii TaxID=1381693 RepID=A0ABP0HTI2_9DINO
MSRIPKPRRKVQQWVITGLSERAPVQGGYQKHGPPGGEALNKREKNELQKLRAQARREGRNPDLVMLPPPKLRRAPKLREPDAILLGPALPTMALPPAEIMDAAQLGRACNAVARGDGAVTLLPGLAHRARELVLELAPRDLTKVLKAFSRQRYEDADLGALLLRQALTRLAYFDAQDLVVLLSSLVRTELKEELMPVAEELRERCPELRGATVLSSACSAAAWLPEPDLRTHRTHPDAVGPMRWRTPLGQVRRLWTPGTGYRPRGDDPHRRPHVRLREGAEAKVQRGHPWVLQNAIQQPEDLEHRPHCLVNVEASDGEVLGVALYNRNSSIALRILSRTAYVRVDAGFFAQRLSAALQYRERLFAEPFYRLAHGEADHLPGLVIDRYDDHLCIQPFSGLDELLWPIADALDEVLKPKVVIIRQDTPGRRREKAALKREVLKGSYQGPSELREHGASFAVDLLSGQKTGWYYDQRENRLMLANLVRGSLPRVLDVYSYVGGFGVLLAHYGAASVLCVDSSEAALELLRRSAAMNAVQSCVRSIRADAMDFLQEKSRQKAAGEDLEDSEFDLVILDPPNLGVDRLTASKALRHYEKLVTAAASLCAPGGMLFVASCTFSIGERELMGVCHRSLAWLQRDYRLVSSGAQAADHPGHLMLPESRYLRALLLHLF